MMEIIADGLRFPEGPIALGDDSVLVVEIIGQRLTRIYPDGEKTVVAELEGGPNGAAIGPDGKVYICNNGGGYGYVEDPEYGLRLHGFHADEYRGGYIERVDLETGEQETIYTRCGDIPLKGPNDLVFDREGGFWFTDTGRRRDEDQDLGSLYYATIDGKHIERVVHPLVMPNGVGLSPGEDRVYAAETSTGRLWAWDITSPGRIKALPYPSPNGGTLVTGVAGYKLFDSLAVDEHGNVLIGTLFSYGISTIAPDGRGEIAFTEMPDIYTTNVCFGGPDLKTLYATLGCKGRLVKMDWPDAGLPINFLNR